MPDLLVLYDFLASLLPGALVVKALASVSVVLSLVGLLRRIPAFEARKRLLAPLAALILGQVFGFASVGFDQSQMLLGAGAGLIIFLAAVGGHSTAKNTLQAVYVRPPRVPREPN